MHRKSHSATSSVMATRARWHRALGRGEEISRDSVRSMAAGVQVLGRARARAAGVLVAL
jgi:hypothetical protein